MHVRLIDIAEVIRSKNAGPYELTLDIIFKEQEMFERVCEADVLNKALFAKLYGVDESKVLDVIYFTPAKAIKATLIRPYPSGNRGESDVYGAQQHGPLLDIAFDL